MALDLNNGFKTNFIDELDVCISTFLWLNIWEWIVNICFCKMKWTKVEKTMKTSTNTVSHTSLCSKNTELWQFRSNANNIIALSNYSHGYWIKLALMLMDHTGEHRLSLALAWPYVHKMNIVCILYIVCSLFQTLARSFFSRIVISLSFSKHNAVHAHIAHSITENLFIDSTKFSVELGCAFT